MSNKKPRFHFEKLFWSTGSKFIAGVDEAGVAPMAGPVVAAAVVLKPGTTLRQIPKTRDSKKLNPDERKKIYQIIKNRCLSLGIGVADHNEIDELNIYHATHLAMRRALKKLGEIEMVLVDGNKTITECEYNQIAIIKGDVKIASIAAASVIAKVFRDELMLEYDLRYPQYGFAQHKGYPTKLHINRLQKFGPTLIHRQTFLKNFREI